MRNTRLPRPPSVQGPLSRLFSSAGALSLHRGVVWQEMQRLVAMENHAGQNGVRIEEVVLPEWSLVG